MMQYSMKESEQDGCSTKMAKYFYGLMCKEKESDLWDKEFLKFAHSRGFLAASASVYVLNEANIDQYLVNYQFYKI